MKHRASQVFVAGGQPSLTYVPRASRNLESRLRTSAEELHKLVTVTGPTKSGKTVLARQVFPRERTVWVDGGSVDEEDDLWTTVLDGISGVTEKDYEKSESQMAGLHGDISGGVQIPLFSGIKGSSGASASTTSARRSSGRLKLSPRAAALAQLRSSGRPLIVDDFHYLKRDLQGSVIRALKPLIFDGIAVVLIAIPHRRYDAVKVEREMTGRLETIDIPVWETDELRRIPESGFPLLNVTLSPRVATALANEAYGSPHLMQEFCRELARVNGITETMPQPFTINVLPDAVFSTIAKGTGKVIYEKLARGPTQRRERILRPLRGGGDSDIYEVVMLALAKLAPGMARVEYEILRSTIRDLLTDKVPQQHEVTQVIEKMASIAAQDEASTPVLDWDKNERVLHITDPFFAFFLKWGMSAGAA